jgi:hypothetical protein
LSLSGKAILILLILSVLLVQGHNCTVVKAQTQSVIATDYSFYEGALDANHRPITRVNGYLRNDPRASLWIAITFLADVPQVTVKSQFYRPDGKLAEEQVRTFPAEKAGESTVLSVATTTIHQGNNNFGIWRVDVYYGPYHLLTESFSVGDYAVDVSVVGFPEELAVKVSIDSENAGTIRGGEKKQSALATGIHTISVNATVYSNQETRYVVDNGSRTVSSQDSQVFQYHREYFVSVTVDSPHGETEGSGWYGEDTSAVFSAKSPYNVSLGVRYVFTNWNGDYKGHSTEGLVVVDGPKNIAAEYKLQYYLRLGSEYDKPRGESWYDSNSTASVSVSPSVVRPDGTRVVFKEWTGDMNSPNNNVTVLMDKPYSLTAEWEVREPVFRSEMSLYLILGAYVLFLVIAGAGLYFAVRRRRS